jgi:beta-lactamase regulating signal transducer with metallopeptidase domain
MNTYLILSFAVDLFLKSFVPLVLAWLILQIWRQTSAAQRGCIWCVALALIAALPFTRLVAPHWALSFSKANAPVALTPTVGSSVIVADESMSAPPVQIWSMPDGATLGVGVWLTGIFLLVAYRLAGAFLLHRFRRSSSPLQDEAGGNMAVSIGTDFGITPPVDIRVSGICQVPVTWGTWRPVVMLPAEALDWPQEWLESALRHEMGHVKNYDHLKRLVTFLTCAFYWPNPLVWVAAKQLQLAQEEASDNLVLRIGVSPQSYAMQLIELIRSNAGRGLLSIPAVAMARPSTLEARLSAILDDTRNRKSLERRMILIGTGLAVVLGLALGTVQLRAADSSSQKTEVTQTNASADDAFIARPDNEPGQVMVRKLKSIIIDKVNFDKVDVAEALQFFAEKSKELDPDKKGINFVLGDITPQDHIHRKFSVTLDNVPLDALLGYVTQQTNLKCSIEGDTVYFRP